MWVYIFLGVLIVIIIIYISCSSEDKELTTASRRYEIQKRFQEQENSNVDNGFSCTKNQTKTKMTDFYSFTLAGLAHRPKGIIEEASELSFGDKLCLEFDEKIQGAIKVMMDIDVHIGYVPSGKIEDVRKIMEENPNNECTVFSVDESGRYAPWIEIEINY